YLTTVLNDPASALRGARYRWTRAAAVTGVVAVAGWTWFMTTGQLKNTVHTERNFFGLLRVKEMGRDDPTSAHRFELHHGTTVHGLQVAIPEFRKLPTAYYGSITGVGALLSTYGPPDGRRIGAVGMGVGTISAYGRPGDRFVYYELDPSVVDVAQTYFSFLEDSEAEYEVRLGDARLNLEREPDQEFDILVLDAFSSDSVPVHLLTVEAMEVYTRHLRPDGIIALNALNNYLNLIPLAFNLADASGFHALGITNEKHRGDPSSASIWIMMSRNADALQELGEATESLRSAGVVRWLKRNPEACARVSTWTDDSSSLFELML
ncbi:MAG: fused MFS/spermidine synthase, partial [Gemmatimonadota bacterium]